MRPPPLTTAAEVLVATGHDPFARSSLRRPAARGWCGEGAVVWLGTDLHEHVPYLSALGAPQRVGALLGAVAPELVDRQRVTLPRGTGRWLPAWVGLQGTDWDFRSLSAPPPRQPGEAGVQLLHDEQEVAALLAASSPTASALPGDAEVRRWLGVRGAGGALLACVADTTSTAGVGHLSSVAVSPAERGRGLGRTVTAALARLLFEEGCDLVALGTYADNTAGRALYDALGFTDDHRFTSGPLLVRSRW